MSLASPDSTLFNPDRLQTPETFSPAQMRVVELESEETGTMRQFDCYELESEEKMFRLSGDEIQVCAIDWADTPDEEAEADVQWIGTGLSYWEVDRIRVFSWPDYQPIRVYRDV